MTTEEALDFAYENPYSAITTEAIYDFHESYFYYDDEGNLKDQDNNYVTEDQLLKKVKGASSEDFNDWIELDIDLSIESSYKDDMNSYMYGDDIEY